MLLIGLVGHDAWEGGERGRREHAEFAEYLPRVAFRFGFYPGIDQGHCGHRRPIIRTNRRRHTDTK